MGHSLTLLTAALLVGQTPVIESSGKNCNCNKGTQGRILAQPEMTTDTRTAGWWTSRGSATTSETWSNGVQQTSWVDDRPVLSRIRGWFRKSDGTTTRIEKSQTSQPVIAPSTTPTNEYNYRRLPTKSEPPLQTTPAPSKPVAPATTKPMQITPLPARPLTIEVEPIEFRPAGSAKGAAPAIVAPAPTPIATFTKPSTRPNRISPRFTDKVGQPGDYSWITGQLEIRNGACLLHYATPETVDQHNGSLALAVDAKLLVNVRSGDLVSVHGSVVHQSGRAAYRVQAIDLIER